MDNYHDTAFDPLAIHVNVASPAGAHAVGSLAFFRYIVRQGELAMPFERADQEALELLGAIPDAFNDEEEEMLPRYGRGWRIVPAQDSMDWPVLEATPQRLRDALLRAQHMLWQHAANWSVSVGELNCIESDLDAVYGVLSRAETAGVPVNVSYVG